ncbi:MAG: cell division protein FtsA [Verrucomicrobiota bacterium]
MAKSNIYVGLEIGTSKICMVVGEVKGDGAIKILGVGQAPSRGVRKGEIVDYDNAQTCLHEALVRAEDRSDVIINNVFLAITGSHIESLNNRGTITLAGDQNEITEEDLEEVKEIARDVPIPQQNVFLHSIIRHYFVDGQDNKVQNPIGMLGTKLEADYHIVHGIRTRIQNAIRCVREIPLEVEDVVFSGVASAQVVLNKDDKSRGAIVVDIGGGTTDYVVYDDGALSQSGCVGIGGDHITNDISIVMKIPLSKAEKLKVEHGSAMIRESDEGKAIKLEDDMHFEGKEIDAHMLNQVIHMRLREVFEFIHKKIGKGSELAKIGAGIFLTGGSSKMEGIDKLAEEIFELPVQRSSIRSMSGTASAFENPQYSTPMGLVRYAQILDNDKPVKGKGIVGFLKRFKK